MVSGSDDVVVRMLQKYFLPTLSKECPSAFSDLLESMAKDVDARGQMTGLQAFVICLSIARKNGLLDDDRISSSGSSDISDRCNHEYGFVGGLLPLSSHSRVPHYSIDRLGHSDIPHSPENTSLTAVLLPNRIRTSAILCRTRCRVPHRSSPFNKNSRSPPSSKYSCRPKRT